MRTFAVATRFLACVMFVAIMAIAFDAKQHGLAMAALAGLMLGLSTLACCGSCRDH